MDMNEEGVVMERKEDKRSLEEIEAIKQKALEVIKVDEHTLALTEELDKQSSILEQQSEDNLKEFNR